MMRVLLVISIAVNVLLASVLAGSAARFWSGRNNGHDHFFQRLAERLPEADGARLRQTVTAHRADLRQARLAYEAAAQHASEVAAAAELDVAALNDALAKLETSRVALLDQRLRVFAEVVPTMSPPGRARLLQVDQ